ncbi:MAG: hypothetical protein M1817_003356 [Caeruleum heppii]|nr:MAG: hypothetical protein M1817_003356 [Caeruleum heppii]
MFPSLALGSRHRKHAMDAFEDMTEPLSTLEDPEQWRLATLEAQERMLIALDDAEIEEAWDAEDRATDRIGEWDEEIDHLVREEQQRRVIIESEEDSDNGEGESDRRALLGRCEYVHWTENELQLMGALKNPPGIVPSLGDLSCPIHPVLARRHWFRISDVDWALMLPALRLVSHVLDEPCLLPFWWAVFFGNRQFLSETSVKYSRICSQIDVPSFERGADPLTETQIQETKCALLGFEGNVYFEMYNFGEEILGACQCSLAATHHLGGSGAAITIYHPLIVALRPERAASTEQMLRAQFMLATTLLHELAHAAHKAVTPLTLQHAGHDLEPFVDDMRQAELGHALEQLLFGGNINRIVGQDWDCQWGITVQRWPGLQDRDGLDSLAMIPSRRDPSPYTSVYPVTMRFLQHLFTRAFWERDIKLYGAQALKIPKEYGIRLVSDRQCNGDSVSVASSENRVVDWEDEYCGWIRPSNLESDHEERRQDDDQMADMS